MAATEGCRHTRAWGSHRDPFSSRRRGRYTGRERAGPMEAPARMRSVWRRRFTTLTGESMSKTLPAVPLSETTYALIFAHNHALKPHTHTHCSTHSPLDFSCYASAGFWTLHCGWRVPFLVTALPAFLCAILIMTTAEEPARGQTEEVVVQFMQQQVRQ